MERNNTVRNVIIAIVLIVALVLILFAVGIFDADTQGEIEAPEVSVQGGELPDVDLDAADVNVGTETTTVETPTIEVDSADANEQ